VTRVIQYSLIVLGFILLVDQLFSGSSLKYPMYSRLCGGIQGVLYYVDEDCILWMLRRMQVRSCWCRIWWK
jgi:hypothetical protein